MCTSCPEADRLPDTSELQFRDMTPEEERAFTYALDCLRTWAAQLSAGADKLSDRAADARPMTPRQITKDRFQMVDSLAHAMQLGFVR